MQVAGDACKEPLSTAGSTSPFATAAGKRLGFGQLAVNTTAANPNRSCVRIKLGSRKVTHQRSSSTYARQPDGSSKQIAQTKSRISTIGSSTQTLVISPGRRRNLVCGTKVGSTWYSASATREDAG